MPKLRFKDREDAGQQLGAELRSYAKERPVIVALPSGGVPVGFEVARSLGAPLDAWVVRLQHEGEDCRTILIEEPGG